MSAYGATLAYHASSVVMVRCAGDTRYGERCRRLFWNVLPSDPQTCWQHRDQEPKP